jgi:hypothetical protein
MLLNFRITFGYRVSLTEDPHRFELSSWVGGHTEESALLKSPVSKNIPATANSSAGFDAYINGVYTPAQFEDPDTMIPDLGQINPFCTIQEE